MSRVIWYCIGVASLHSVIGLKITDQSEVKPKPIFALSHTFSRALCRLHVFAFSFDWFIGRSVSSVIGQINYFRFGLKTHKNENRSVAA